MPIDIETTQSPTNNNTAAERHAYRFHAPHLHLQSVFGDDWFALKAEAFARFFGTPTFLITQTVIVAVWILVNVLGLTTQSLTMFRIGEGMSRVAVGLAGLRKQYEWCRICRLQAEGEVEEDEGIDVGQPDPTQVRVRRQF